MTRFLYTAWFRDETVTPDEQDYEWPACFVVEAERSEDAQSWGDQLARSFSARRGTEHYLWSEVVLAESDADELPVVRVGELADDEKIGW